MRSMVLGALALVAFVAGPATAASMVIGGTVVDDQGQFSAMPGATTIDFNGVPLGQQAFTVGLATYQASIFACACVGNGDLRDDTTRGARALVGTPLTIDFAAPVRAFGLYWGSPDRGNAITLYDGGSAVFTATGADVGPLVGFGHPGAGYVTFTAGPDERFTRVVLSSTDYPFETDNHAYVEAVPEPAMLLLAAAGLGMRPRSRR